MAVTQLLTLATAAVASSAGPPHATGHADHMYRLGAALVGAAPPVLVHGIAQPPGPAVARRPSSSHGRAAAAATVFTPLPASRQTQHQMGVPHTNRVGQTRLAYDPEVSFLPLVLYHSLINEHFYGENYSGAEYTAAGFNTLHYWPAIPLAAQVAFSRANGFQTIAQIGTSPNASAMTEIVRPYATDDAVLGWFLEEEPTGAKGCFKPAAAPTPPTCQLAWDAYTATKRGIKAIDTTHAVFNLDCAWTDVDAAGNDPRAWWHKWNSDGDVSCHDNYPFPGGNPAAPGKDPALRFGWGTLARKQGITETVPLAVRAVNESKPVWLTIQAFEQPGGPSFWWTMPTEAQLRVQAYSAAVFGAAGVIYFALDSWVTRVGDVIGIGPATPFMTSTRNGGGTPINATASSARASRLLWAAAGRLNRELTSLASAILSPTDPADYAVGFAGNNFSATPLRSVLKQDPARGLVLLAVNVDVGTMQGEFTFAAGTVPKPTAPVIRCLFEGTPADAAGQGRAVAVVSAGGGWSFVDHFAGFDSHAYVL
jgi:hypothetical protein